MIKLLTILFFWAASSAKAQESLHSSNVIRYGDLKNIQIILKPSTDSVFLYWCGGGKSFLYRDSVEVRMQPALDAKANASHTHAISEVTNLQTTLNGKANTSHTHATTDLSDFSVTSVANNQLFKFNSATGKWENWTPNFITANQSISLTGDITGSGATSISTTIANNAVSNAKAAQMATNTIKGNNTGSTANASDLSASQVKTLLAISESDVASLTTDLNAKAPLASPTLTGTPAAPTASSGTNTTQIATTAFVQAASDYGSYMTLLETSGSHTAARVAGTYGLGDGDPAAISGTGTLYPLKTIFIAAADYPSVDGKATKLRLRAQLYVNDVAPTGNYTFGLYPITRPGTSGGAGLDIYTLGTVVSGSTVAFNTPAADGLLNGASGDFSLPADGHYVIGFVSTAAVATSSHLHMVVILQKHNN